MTNPLEVRAVIHDADEARRWSAFILSWFETTASSEIVAERPQEPPVTIPADFTITNCRDGSANGTTAAAPAPEPSQAPAHEADPVVMLPPADGDGAGAPIADDDGQLAHVSAPAPDWAALVARVIAGEKPEDVAPAGVKPQALRLKAMHAKRKLDWAASIAAPAPAPAPEPPAPAPDSPEPEPAPEPEAAPVAAAAISAGYWTPARDLEIAESIIRSFGFRPTAEKLGLPISAIRERWDFLLPVKGWNEQIKLMARLRKAVTT
jgi:hypothetical protein